MSRSGSHLLVVLAIVAVLAIGLAIYRLFALSSPVGIVTAAMCGEVNADNEPLGATTVFEADAETLHCAVAVTRARRGARLKAVYIAVDALEAPNYVVDVVETLLDGAGHVDLALHRNETLWPAGSYRVELYLDDVWQRTLIFEINSVEATPSPEPPTPAPSPVPTVRPTITPAQAGARVAEASLARCAPAEGQAMGSVSRFSPDEAAFCYKVHVVGAPAQTMLEAAWRAEGGGDNLTLIRSTRYQVEGSQQVVFRLVRGESLWPAGNYRVELSLDGELVRVDEFTVESAP